ncbi:cysteine hydrolase family protein [Salinicola rhizosphaerae]|uniref:Isochorismatase n=1 Tax=Salinicola rhizosphaerae TaxID=1443141 RepID=A0ABQ3DPK4_9GAMM|nr:isochorismatase family cysteine hydrolase [Salinicola rhizosphaerae]GHB10720.1 isochorismatase [Salinicola rhizosphaerae]
MSRSALLIMDLQNGILAGYSEAQKRGLIERANTLIADARDKQVPIIFVAVRQRPGYLGVGDNNKAFSGLKKMGVLIEGSETAAFHPDLAVTDEDVVVVKRRFGAASTTDLASVLNAVDADHLVMAGVSTSGVVLSTVRWAADLDYRLTVLADACLDHDEEVHRVLTEKVFPVQADVIDSGTWLARNS